MARPPRYPPEFEASYREVMCGEDGVAYTKAQREEAKQLALFDWNMARANENQEDPIAEPGDSPAEALEKIVSHSLKSMTPSDAVKHRSQLLKFAGDTVLLDRKARLDKAAEATGLSRVLALFAQVARGEIPQGPGWVDATVLPTLSAREQANATVEAEDAADEPQRVAQ